MPMLSLILPAQKRSRYAGGTIETILAMGDDTKPTMSDTSAKTGWDTIVYPRLKIARPASGISFVDNFDIPPPHALIAGVVAEAGRALRRVWQWLTVRFAVMKDERSGSADTIAMVAEIFDGIAAGPNLDLSRA